MSLTTLEIMELYQRRASRYDLTSRLQTLIGFRIDRYRRLAVRTLNLKPGDAVVDIGCGTGANFRALHAAVGGQGRIIGVDLSEAMLAQAWRRVRKNGWRNVELHHADAGTWSFPDRVQGVLSTFALTMIPHCGDVIGHGARVLTPGGRFVILDVRIPASWPAWLLRAWAWNSRPFGLTPECAERMPWLSLYCHVVHVRVRPLYFGRAYLAYGDAPDWRDIESAGCMAETQRITGIDEERA